MCDTSLQSRLAFGGADETGAAGAGGGGSGGGGEGNAAKRPRLHRTSTVTVPETALVPGFHLEDEFLPPPDALALDRASDAGRAAQLVIERGMALVRAVLAGSTSWSTRAS